ncbi:MAG: quinol:electron acceptor oxidoreductase subunit ActD, partial [Thermoguttaceae bacterium]
SPEPPRPVAGMLAQFKGPATLKVAASRIRDEGFSRWDVHSPFPIHGIDRAMGIRPTILPWLVFGAGMTGAVVALLMQWWMNAIDYPMNISGKPLFSLPANIPIIFEVIVLFSAIAAFGGVLVLNRLPQFSHAVFSAERFRRVTTDGFLLVIDAADPKFDEAATRTLLESLEPDGIETFRETANGRGLPTVLVWGSVVVVALALLPPLLIARARGAKSASPRIHIIQDMDFQPKYKTQTAGPLFADGRAMRPPVPGTIADGQLDDDPYFDRGYLVLGRDEKGEEIRDYFTTFPIRVDMATILRGQERFGIYCAPCHGLVGEGGATGIVSIRALDREEELWVLPRSMHAKVVREQPPGELFNTITNGKGRMPAYGPQIPVEDRWAIVLYEKALQRSQNATIDDVPEEDRPHLR